MVFEPQFEPELSSDVEWMLQSGQVDLPTLAETLIHQYYPPVFRLCHALLLDERLALTATLDTFGDALAGVHEYRSAQGVEQWLYARTIKTCRGIKLPQTSRQPGEATSAAPALETTPRLEKTPLPLDQLLWQTVDNLPGTTRLVLILRVLLELPLLNISKLTGIAENRAAKLLEQGRAACRLTLHEAGLALSAPDPDDDRRLAAALQNRWPLPTPDAEHLEQVIQASLLAASSAHSQRRMSVPFKELLFILPVLLLVVGLIWGADRLLPPGDPNPAPRIVTQLVVVTPVAPQATAAPETSPLLTPTPTRPFYPPYPEEAYYVVQPGDTLALLGKELGYTVEDLRQLNRIPAGASIQAGQKLLIPRMLTPGPPAVEAIQPFPTPASPLSQDTSLREIRDRMLSPGRNWNSVWMDISYHYNPGPAVRGAGQAYRVQAWILPDLGLFAYGPAGSDPAEVVLSYPGNVLLARPAQGVSWFTPVEDLTELAFFFRLLSMLYVDPPWSQGEAVEQNFSIGERVQVAGREALFVTQLGAGEQGNTRYCVDIWTGSILCQARWLPARDTPYLEMTVREIAYNIQPPASLFDPYLPWRGGYARNATGDPIPLNENTWQWSPPPTPRPRAYQPMPPSFDPGQAQLSILYPETPNLFDPNQRDGSLPVFLYAEGYFLGAPGFSNPMFLVCQRSADGNLLAYAYPGMDPNTTADSTLRWFRLDQPAQQIEPSPELQAMEFAISPDSNRLAVFGFTPDGNRGLFLVDSSGGSHQRLIRIDSARSILWSPDGSQVVMLGRHSRWDTQEEVWIISVEDGGMISQYPFEQAQSKNPGLPGWLAEIWGTRFPYEMDGVEACLLPPAP
jgi:DNA-directed RNA polymerase specialized sigma24 family protein/LysM repeat protein